MRQVRTAADALIGSATACPTCRAARLANVAERIAWVRARNRPASARATIGRLDELGIDVATLRCCIWSEGAP